MGVAGEGAWAVNIEVMVRGTVGLALPKHPYQLVLLLQNDEEP